MATRRRSSATPATAKKSTAAPKVKVTKYQQPVEIKTMTETPTTEVPQKVRPENPNLSLKDYQEDFKVRMEIHNWEVNELISDIKNGWKSASPYVKQTTEYLNKTFSQVRERFQSAN